ncbi:MAG: hypothetical protein JSS68_03675 [Actinobacteria bacterium]|nr:hypothetical protein [Actinomycetota bacterium]
MRLVRHLSFSNVIAVIALFVALGGAAYAGSKINGKNIVNASIGGGKLKHETITASKIKRGTITGAQIKAGSIDSNAIDLATLGTVPSASNANSANSANTASSADTAKTATKATEADRAASAGEAEKLGGETRAELQTELTLSCPSTTELYGGMCWDKANRAARLWLGAIKECGEEGGRLPSIEELIAFVLRPGEQVEEQTWSADLIEASGSEGKVFTTDEGGRGETGPGLHRYRCVFYPSN